MRTLIQNGTVYDGTGAPGRRCNVLLEDARIAELTEGTPLADQVIDATGCAVTPGFIDTHRHCDLDAIYNPDFGKLERAQGITSAFCGNCGLAPIPTFSAYAGEIFSYIEPCLGIAPPEMRHESFASFLEVLGGHRIHLGSFIGLGSLKAAVRGYGRGALGSGEIQKMQSYIKAGLEAGAAGISTGIMYQPECYGTKEEYIQLLSAAAPYGKPLTCHIRGEGDSLVPSVEEVVDIAFQAGLPLNISHFKATGIRNWEKGIFEAIEVIEKARSRGQDITVDFYPYLGGSTTLLSLLPPTVMGDTVAETLGNLRGDKLSGEIAKTHDGWDNMVESIGWERIVISSVTLSQNRIYCNMNFLEAAHRAGFSDPALFMAELLREEDGKVGIIVLSMCQADVDAVAKLPYSMVISDSLYGVSDCPHPRLYGSFPKIIREYVLERKVLTLESAVHKMTGLPAKRLALKDRGVLEAGRLADVNIFNPDQFRDKATFSDPKQLAVGLKYVFVGGVLTDTKPGQTIRI